MQEEEFRRWLAADYAASTIGSHISRLKRVERSFLELGIKDEDLDAAFDADELAGVIDALRRVEAEIERGGSPPAALVPVSENYEERVPLARKWVEKYRDFRLSEGKARLSQADQIRRFVIERYAKPARTTGVGEFNVVSGDVHRDMGLSNAMPAVCSALDSRKFGMEAGVSLAERQGPANSSTVRFRFKFADLAFGRAFAEAELLRRYGSPITDSEKIIAFALRDGRQIACQRDVSGVQLWIEDPETASAAPAAKLRHYLPEQTRHSNLPQRLKHAPSGGAPARRVAMVTIDNASMLRAVLDWYENAGSMFNREALEQLKQTFLARYPDFEPGAFAGNTGGYFDEERAYKNVLIARTATAVADCAGESDAVLGARLLDLLTGVGGAKSGLLGWRTDGHIKALRSRSPGVLEALAGQLARANDIVAGIDTFVKASWPLLSDGQTSKPYSESRNIPSMLAALVHPDRAFGINTDPLARTARAVTGAALMGSNPLTSNEYAKILSLSETLKTVMASEWNWAPRDLWDVQGFIWAVNRADPTPITDIAQEANTVTLTSAPTNLILYGPPGTGKTFATAEEAVRLCNVQVPASREALMTEYQRLVASGQIEFVTFHQSYSYEEFVEGLRPIQGDGELSAGFQLKPEPGTFRRIARRAETSTGSGAGAFIIGDRQVFKMSIGEASNPDDAQFFDEAIESGRTLLGFDDIDWSDSRFASRDAIIEACQAYAPDEPKPNAMTGRVQCPFIFRNWMKDGDLVIVSKGNSLFRAIGEVTGGYEYAQRESGIYSHRRAVRWLWIDRAGVPVEEIYARGFMMKSIYLLTHADINVPALERYIASQQDTGGAAPESFVLVIDEINRANISKVFGELITLLEHDKRLGAKNELRVRLPYSREMFGVPANLHVVGTMNTADRSIALLDTALRRRFSFREIMPDPTLLLDDVDGINLQALLTTINERIEYLFDREHQIGHAYLMGAGTRSAIDDVMRDKVIPLLAEYFYEDWSKVAAVLGDAAGEGRFLDRVPLKPPAGMDTDGSAETRYRWNVKRPFADNAYDQFG